MVGCKHHVHGWHHEQGERRADRDARRDHETHGEARNGAGAGRRDEWMTPSTIAAVVMRIGRRRMPAAISMASRLDFPACCFRLPTACSFGCQSDRATLVVDTVCGRLPMLAMKAFTWPSSKTLKPKTPASTAPTRTNMMIIRLIIALNPLLAAARQLDVLHRRQI